MNKHYPTFKHSLTRHTAIALAIAALCAMPLGTHARQKTSVLSLSQTITDNDIVFPESFQTNTHEMMKNWYLQNYTILDADVENRDAAVVSDAEYAKRLAAMPTIIEMPYNQVVRSYIDRYITRNRTLVEEMLGMSLYYMPIFEQALEAEGLPLELKYLPVVESALDPTATSRAGAAGLWQFMVGTGKGLGLEVNSLVDERRDPYRSSAKAAAYLKDLYNIYNDWSLAIAAYNCGPGNVNQALQRCGKDNADFWTIYAYLPRETRGYLPAFIAANYVMTYFKQHNISPSLARKPLITDTVSVSRRIHFNQIADVLNMPVEEIRILNPQYRADIIPGNNHPYTLCLPSQQVYSYILSEDSIANYRRDAYAQREVVEPEGIQKPAESRTVSYETKTVTQSHRVGRGESASSIAARYGMSANSLLALNGLKRGTKVKRGQVLKVQTTKRVKVYHDAPTESADNDDYDGITVVHSRNVDNPENEPDEAEQINEVRRVEQAADESIRRRQQQAGQTAVQPQPQKVVDQQPADNSKQWRGRNQRYADNTPAQGRETTYKHSRSSRSAESRQNKHSHHKTHVAAQPATTNHTIKEGESLNKIAKRNGVTVEELKKVNGITGSGNTIKIGETIKVPNKNASKSSGKKSSRKVHKGADKKSSGSKARKKRR